MSFVPYRWIAQQLDPLARPSGQWAAWQYADYLAQNELYRIMRQVRLGGLR